MFMENKDFYPTPKELGLKLIDGIDLRRIYTILEPGAGKGDLLKIIQSKEDEYSQYSKPELDIDCIEIEENLQYILKGQGIRVIHDDFLTFDTFKKYDLIIANFPFSEGDKHLMKAIQLQERYGGKIRCLINAETIRNAYSNVRNTLLQKLRQHNADVEFLTGEFLDAERKTDVEVALIKIDIEKPCKTSVLLDNLQKDISRRSRKPIESNDLISGNLIDGIVAQYNFEIEAGLNLIEEYEQLRPHILSDLKEKNNKPILSLTMDENSSGNDTFQNRYVKKVRGKYWKALFQNPDFVGKLTSNLQTDLMGRVNDLRNYDLSHYNICVIKFEMQKSMISGVEETILKLFDDMSHRYAYGDGANNTLHYDGWKTNCAYKVNAKKVIFPCYGAIGKESWDNGELTINWSNIDELNDLQKVLNYLDDGSTVGKSAAEVLRSLSRTQTTKSIECKYFILDFYKKGTVHIKWTCPELIEKFNIFGSQRRGWLPPSYGKAGYDDMSSEERAIIDDFQGKEMYEKILQKRDYFITETSSLLMLDGEAS